GKARLRNRNATPEAHRTSSLLLLAPAGAPGAPVRLAVTRSGRQCPPPASGAACGWHAARRARAAPTAARESRTHRPPGDPSAAAPNRAGTGPAPSPARGANL